MLQARLTCPFAMQERAKTLEVAMTQLQQGRRSP